MVVLVGLGLSAAIELGQLAISLHLGYGYRAADVDDVILNTLGTLIGLGVFVITSTTVRLIKRLALESAPRHDQ